MRLETLTGSHIFRNPGIALLGFILFLGMQPYARADSTYTYTGQPFTEGDYWCGGSPCSPYTTADAIHFQFTTTTPLGDNWTDVPPSGIQSWSLSVGPLHDSSSNPLSILYSINFSTGATGNIIGYQFVILDPVAVPGLLPQEYFGSSNPSWENPPYPWYTEEVLAADLSPYFEDGVYIPSIFQDGFYADNQSKPGTWAVTSTPEPSTMLLLGSALLGFGGSKLRARLAPRRK